MGNYEAMDQRLALQWFRGKTAGEVDWIGWHENETQTCQIDQSDDVDVPGFVDE